MPDRMGDRIKQTVSEFLNTENPVTLNKFGGLMDHFALRRPGEDGVELVSIDNTLRKAEKCLASLLCESSNQKLAHSVIVTKLGKKKEKQQGQQSAEDLAKTALQMARVLAAFNEEIELSVVSRDNRMGQIDTEFRISAASDMEPVVSMIRGVYGSVETRAPQNSVAEAYPWRYSAEGRFAFKGRENAKREKEYGKYRSWISSVLNSLPTNGNYTASIRFVPLEKLDDIDKKIQELREYHSELSFYAEMNWSSAGNAGVSLNHQSNLLQKGPEAVLGADKMSENIACSMNLSAKEVDYRAKAVLEELEFAVTRLKTARTLGAWGVQFHVAGDSLDTLQTVSAVLAGTLSEQGLTLCWENGFGARATIANTEEILPMMRFPEKEFAGFEFIQNDEFSLVSPNGADSGFELGKILWNSRPFSPFCLSGEAFNRHAFVCGMTGSGKSNTVFNIIEGVGLPCVVIEPVKGEYRALRSVFPDLRVWTMKAGAADDASVSVLRINPFWFPKNSNLAFHIDSLKTIISSAFDLYAAMPNILEQCLYNVYIKTGWDLITNRNIYADRLPEEYLYPTFSNLCVEVEEYLNQSDFGDEVLGNYKGALLSRLKSFVNGYKGILLNTSAFPDYARFMNGHSVIELEGLAEDADKCLVMGTILVQYYEYLKQNFKDSEDKKRLNHLIVIEEAHRLFKRAKKSKSAESGPDPTGQLVESLSNMMAEIRAFGEGMLIVDQSPTKLADDVVKNSAAKIIHRIDNGEDIKVLQSSMLLPDDTISFAALKQGEALVRTDKMTKPCKVLMKRNEVKERYSLADSFSAAASEGRELGESFAATSILYNEEITHEIQDLLRPCLNSLAVTDLLLWYEIVSELLGKVIRILKQRKAFDMVDYRMSVLFKIILLAVQKDPSFQSALEMGEVHLFLSRVFEFYAEKRNGMFVKDGVLRIFRAYFRAHIQDSLISLNLDGVDSELREREAPEALDPVLYSLILHYCDLLKRLDLQEIDPQAIEACFYEKELMLSVQIPVYDAHSEQIFKTINAVLSEQTGGAV